MLTITYQRVRRAIDVIGSLMGGVLTSPVVLFACIAARLDDGPPVFFRQERVGKSGELFFIIKIRTMSTSAPRAQSSATIGSETHVTRVGRILRRANVDELPQLLNVLLGDMSLIGPRPALPSQSDLLEARSPAATALRPGLTGLAQVNSFDGMTSTQKARFDNEYARTVGIGQDLAILAKTVTYLRHPPPTY